jgi:hypothetical protein
MARKVLNNIGDPLLGLRRTLKQLITDRNRIEELFRRGGCIDDECRRRLATLDTDIRSLRAAALDAMQERRNFQG